MWQIDQGGRYLLKLISSIPLGYFAYFSTFWMHMLAIEYRVHIWQVSPQLDCGSTCQIWMWIG